MFLKSVQCINSSGHLMYNAEKFELKFSGGRRHLNDYSLISLHLSLQMLFPERHICALKCAHSHIITFFLSTEKLHFTSGHWNVREVSAADSEEKYSCCPEAFSQITYTIRLRRIPSYYLLYLVLPCLFLCILTLGQFFIPPETGERIGFGITTVLAMSVYLLVISDKLPEKSDQTPLLGLLYVILFFLMVFELMGCVVTTYFAFKTTPPPTWLLEKLVKKGRVLPVSLKKASVKKKESVPLPDIQETDLNSVTHVEKEFNVDSQRLRRTFSATAEVDDMAMKYQLLWGEIAHQLDKILFYVFIALTFLSPALVLGVYEATE